MPNVPSADQLVAMAREHTLAQAMSDRFELRDDAALKATVESCAVLHREGRLDVLALVEDGDISKLETGDFFGASHLLCDVFLRIEAPVDRMMTVIDALVTRAGADLAANHPNGTFRSWCAAEPQRALTVIQEARAGSPLALKFLTFALEAVHAMAEAWDLAHTGSLEERMSAVTALSRMAHPEAADYQRSLDAFRAVADAQTEDRAHANLLHSLGALMALNGRIADSSELALLDLLLASPGDFTLHEAAGVLWRHPKVLTVELTARLLAALVKVNPGNTGTINDLDMGLRELQVAGYGATVIDFLDQLFGRPDIELSLGQFDSFTDVLVRGPPEGLSRAVTHWLVKGSRQLCEGLSNALGHFDRDQPIALLPADLMRPPAELVLLCERAIGFLFLQPKLAASIVVGVLRACPPEMAPSVADLLAETLLINYGGIRDYLESLDPADPAKPHVVSALAQNKDYLNALRSVPDLPELRPSEHHRGIERQRMSDHMRESYKAAQRESVFLNMIHRQVILHGNGTLSYIAPPGGERRPMEMQLHSHGVSFEMPRVEIVDPVGLDYLLRLLRNRRRDA